MTLEDIVSRVVFDQRTTISCGPFRDDPSRFSLVINGDQELIKTLCDALTGDDTPWEE